MSLLLFQLKWLMFFSRTRVSTMTRTVTVQSWTIQAVQNPANHRVTGENLTSQPTQTLADPAGGFLSYSYSEGIMIRDIEERQETKALVFHHKLKRKINPWWVSSKNILEKKHENPISFRGKCITVMWNWIGTWAESTAQQTPLWSPQQPAQDQLCKNKWHLSDRRLGQRGPLPDCLLISSSRSICIFSSTLWKCVIYTLFHIMSHENIIIKSYQGFYYTLMFLLTALVGQTLMLLLALNLWNVLISKWSLCHIEFPLKKKKKDYALIYC